MKVVSDTSVLVDLDRGSLLEAAFRPPFEFAVPDLLYMRELEGHSGEKLRRLGLRVLSLDGDGVMQALNYRKLHPALSLPDCFALTLAARQKWTLLTGDAKLRRLAKAEQVDCHGVLWLLDEMLKTAAASIGELHSSLTVISEHPRCRLPKAEVQKRLKHYKTRKPTA